MSGEDQTNSYQERRNRERVSAEKLPKGMRQFSLDFGPGEVYTGQTIDASLSSISFRVEVPANRIREHIVTLVSADKKIKMTQELVYIKPVEAGLSRISFMLDSDNTPALYRRMVGRALNR
ncbi:MAG: hypothetical protein ACOC2R_10025 [Spirochaetota bacterium]